MVDQSIGPKLRKAGADGVVSPNFIGGLRMASEMFRPTVVDFLDSMLRSSQGNIRINQININKNSRMIGKKISELGLTEKFSLIVLGSKHRGSDIIFNPSLSSVLIEDSAIIVMGDAENIAKAKLSV